MRNGGSLDTVWSMHTFVRVLVPVLTAAWPLVVFARQPVIGSGDAVTTTNQLAAALSEPGLREFRCSITNRTVTVREEISSLPNRNTLAMLARWQTITARRVAWDYPTYSLLCRSNGTPLLLVEFPNFTLPNGLKPFYVTRSNEMLVIGEPVLGRTNKLYIAVD